MIANANSRDWRRYTYGEGRDVGNETESHFFETKMDDN
jgi:hypothetical protein